MRPMKLRDYLQKDSKKLASRLQGSQVAGFLKRKDIFSKSGEKIQCSFKRADRLIPNKWAIELGF
jgi:hypothetical protein